ncbi:MAG: nascent polypeptide-associated complex protein [Euryarchaeota archaeon]
MRLFPGGKIDPRKLQRLMREMQEAMEQEEVKVERVVMELKDGSRLVFERPQVVRMRLMGQEFYQVAGKARREEPEEKPSFTEEDVKLVAERAGVSEEEARRALEETDGDLAEAIMRLQED